MLQDTLNLLNGDDLEQLVYEIQHRKHLLIFATGTSVPAGEWLFDRLLHLGYHVSFVKDSYAQLAQAASLPEEDESLCIFISKSGTPQPLVDAQAILRNRCPKVKNVLLTCSSKSLMALHSDICLLAASKESAGDVAGSQVGMMSLINSIYICLVKANATEMTVQKCCWDL